MRRATRYVAAAMLTSAQRGGSPPTSRTVAATRPAAAGVGRPTKKRRSPVPVCTLNRASRSAPQITNRKAPSHAEGHDIGQRVELDAELARGPHQACDPPVEHVHDDRDEDRERRLVVPELDAQDHGEEAAEQVAGREQARQQEDPAAALAPELLPPAAAGAETAAAHQRSTPITLSPPLTRSPTCAWICVSRGTVRSVRE